MKRSDFSISSDDLVAPLSLTLLKGESPTALCSITLRSEGTAIRKVEGLHVMSLKARDTAEYSGSTDGKKEDLLEAISASEKKKASAIFFEVFCLVFETTIGGFLVHLFVFELSPEKMLKMMFCLLTTLFSVMFIQGP